MRVHNPRPGEAADRLSVLALKIMAAGAAGKSVDHFEQEKEELFHYVADKFSDHQQYDFMVCGTDSLLKINYQIWQYIDLQHQFDAPDKQYADWSRETVRLNDLRAGLIKQINLQFGIREGDEKV